MNGYDKLTEEEIKELSETAWDVFHLTSSFGRNENITNFANVWMLEDRIQLSHTITCGPFQIHFTRICFFPTKTANYTITKNLLNELFLLNRENNERILNEYIEQRLIQMT